MRFDVISFGSATVDIFVNTELYEKKGRISYPVGSKIKINETRTFTGGGGINSAVAFSRFGLKTGCICSLGDDYYAENILDLLKKEKVKFLGKINRNSKTDFSITLDSKGKDRTSLVHKKINNELDFENLNLKKIKTDWLYLSTSLGKSFQTQKKLVRILSKKGVKIAFNPSEYLLKEEDVKPLLKVCEVFICNKEEAELLIKKGDLLKGLHELGPKIVVITNGDKLISCYDGAKKYFLKPNKIKVVEKTGAGDAFSSGFVAGRIVGKSILESLKLGRRESELAIKYFGATTKLLNMKLK